MWHPICSRSLTPSSLCFAWIFPRVASLLMNARYYIQLSHYLKRNKLKFIIYVDETFPRDFAYEFIYNAAKANAVMDNHDVRGIECPALQDQVR